MKTLVCVLLVLGVVSAQNEIVQQELTTLDAGNHVNGAETETTLVASAVDDATASAVAGVADATDTAGAATGDATGAQPAGGQGTAGHNYGRAFYGPGLNNPHAIPPNGNVIKIFQNYLKTAPNGANLRVLVEKNGEAMLTNQYGQEAEFSDPKIAELVEIAHNPIELYEHIRDIRLHTLEKAVARCEAQLRNRHFTDPAAFTPNYLKGLEIPTVTGGRGGAGLGAGARAVLA